MTASKENKTARLLRIICSIIVGFPWYYSPFNKLRKIQFIDDDTLIEALNNGKSIARFGDGELRIMENIPSNFFQKNDINLAKTLQKVTKFRDDRLILCFPKPLKTLEGLTIASKLFWVSNIFWNRKRWKKYIQFDRLYGNTQITRPYIDYRNKSMGEYRYSRLKTLWENKKICIIEGENTHLGENNDLLSNAKEIRRIIAPATNAFSKYDKILDKAKNIKSDYIFLISLGPTATILSKDLAEVGRTAFDIGHIDIEYEWMKKGSKKKEAILGKAVNETRRK